MVRKNNTSSCKNCDRNRHFLRIVEKIIGAIVAEENIQQQIAEELAQIMGLERCVIFRVYHQMATGHLCQIVAGTPIGEHGVGFVDLLASHPDLQEVYTNREPMHVTKPLESQYTSYFHYIIEQKKISEILYLPLITGSSKKKVRGIIVLDAVEMIFDEGDIDFCVSIGRLISMTLDREEVLYEKWRDRLLNPTVGLGGFAQRITGKADQILSAVSEIRSVSNYIETMFVEDQAKVL
jgi:GAF domain-containing protein